MLKGTEFTITDLATKVTTINKVITLTAAEQVVTFSINPGNGGAIVYYKSALTH